MTSECRPALGVSPAKWEHSSTQRPGPREGGEDGCHSGRVPGWGGGRWGEESIASPGPHPARPCSKASPYCTERLRGSPEVAQLQGWVPCPARVPPKLLPPRHRFQQNPPKCTWGRAEGGSGHGCGHSGRDAVLQRCGGGGGGC